MITMSPEVDENIASVSPVCGCTGRCVYCYIDMKNYDIPRLNSLGIEKTIEELLKNKTFMLGHQGSFLCVGVWGEIFAHADLIRKESFLWISELVKLGNPIVLITKGYLSKEDTENLKKLQKYKNQITVLVSVTTKKYWRKIEPGTVDPSIRFQTMRNLKESGIECCLFINPFLKGISNLDYVEFLKMARINGVSNVVISPLYYNDKLTDKLRKLDVLRNIMDNHKVNDVTGKHHMKNDSFEVIADDLWEDKEELLHWAIEQNMNCWFHYSCFLAHLYKRRNEYHYGREDICRECGHCKRFL